MQGNGGLHWITCPCGKRGYRTKADARTKVRELRRTEYNRGNDHPMGIYWCEVMLGGTWHVGHRPLAGRRDLNG